MIKRILEWMMNVFEPAPIAKPKPRPQVKKPAVKKTAVKKPVIKTTKPKRKQT
jgi:hypothetical protein